MRASGTSRARRAVSKGRSRQSWVVKAFKDFGRHCARNQIRVLIIDSFVMTTLFYPALALYLQRQFPPLRPPSSTTTSRQPQQKEHPLSLLSTPILDSFFPYPPALLPPVPSHWFWEGASNDTWTVESAEALLGRHADNALSRHELVLGTTVAWTSVETVLDGISNTTSETDLALKMEMEDLIQVAARSIGRREHAVWSCVPSTNSPSQCYIDRKEPDVQRDNPYSYVTVYFQRLDGSGSTTSAIKQFDSSWREQMRVVGRQVSGETFYGRDVPGGRREKPQKLVWSIALGPGSATSTAEESQLDLHEHSQERRSTIPRPILGLFVALISWLLWLLARATNVHSRFGLAFTGVVELTCSSVMSYSVLTLLEAAGIAWRSDANSSAEPRVPWYILPFVILVVGVENMSALTRAVHSIPVSASVPDRIGLGLAEVGPRLFITSATDILILAIVGFVIKLRPVREFCTFACVLIFVDWWMLHTFYLTVLSIDCQRLELADLLQQGTKSLVNQAAQNGSAVPNGKDVETITTPSQAPGKTATTKANIGWLLGVIRRARRARIGSLTLFIFLLTTLFYVNESHHSRAATLPGLYGYKGEQGVVASGASALDQRLALHSAVTQELWRTFNPGNRTRIALVTTSPSTIVLPTVGHAVTPQELRKLSVPSSRLWLPRFRPVFYLFKVVLLPQWLTAFILYVVLLYLLKDAQLLDAQRDRRSIADGGGARRKGIESSGTASRVNTIKQGLTSALTTPIFPIDIVNIIALEGKTVQIVAVSAEGHLQLCTQGPNGFAVKRLSSSMAGRKTIFAAGGEFVALAIDDGRLELYRRSDGETTVKTLVSEHAMHSPISALSLRSVPIDMRENGFLLPRSSQGGPDRAPEILASHVDGSLWAIDVTGSQEQLVAPASGGVQSCLLETTHGGRFFVVRATDGKIAVWDVSMGQSLLLRTFNTYTDGNAISTMALGVIGRHEQGDFVLCIGMSSGSVAVWHVASGTLLLRCDSNETDDRSAVNKITWSAMCSQQGVCARCYRPTADRWNLLWSTSSYVHMSTLTIATREDDCQCYLLKSPRQGPTTSLDVLPDDLVGVLGKSPRKGSSSATVRTGLLPQPPRPLSPREATPPSRSTTSSPGSGAGSGPDDHATAAPFAVASVSKSWTVRRAGWTCVHGDTVAAILSKTQVAATALQDSQWRLTIVDLTRTVGDINLEASTPLDLTEAENAAAGLAESQDARHVQSVQASRARRLSSMKGNVEPETASLQNQSFPLLSFSKLTSVVSVGVDSIAIGMGNRVALIRLPRGSPSPTASATGTPSTPLHLKTSSTAPPPRYSSSNISPSPSFQTPVRRKVE